MATKEIAKKLMDIMMCFMLIRILVGIIIFGFVFNGHYDYENEKLMPNIC